ncbi:cytidylyltransferase [freshwater metagenome]|uniref:Cytidylyltransferase n=1 Tax=freshwater metagenome TaxID=449393 RepID=A0A094SR85_9ZZZZ
MRTVAVVQARLKSTRFPRKVLARIGPFFSLELLLIRLARAEKIDEIIVAIAEEEGHRELEELLSSMGYKTFVGETENVLSRIIGAGRKGKADIVVRITGDCPFIDPQIVDDVIELRSTAEVEYASNVSPSTFPDGLDVEVFTLAALERSLKLARDASDLEHVTPKLRSSGNFTTANLESKTPNSKIRITLDEVSDLTVLREIFDSFGGRTDFSCNEITNLFLERPGIFVANGHISRNEGVGMGLGQKLWKHAKSVIPGGNMLLSKRSEMFLPDQWPSYFSKAKGCEVWDLDGKHYFDMASMGVGTNTLGYGNNAVDEAVMRTIRNGNMSTLNCPEEVELADRLLEINPWAGMVRLARTGGEANAIAVRIARAATGKDKVAICGYHGWHDWYLSANLADDANLDGHLLPGLEPNGVPRQLKGTVVPFEYNDLSKLKEIISAGDVAAIKMEVFRSVEPEDNFLGEVRKLASEKGVILIFDECTSGFRETFGGLHIKYGVEPDIAVYGKALGNGYAITAVVGKSEVMHAAQASFISSTFWTERIGPSAAVATLSEMERMKSWDQITSVGDKVRSGWRSLADQYQLGIKVSGLPALSTFTFDSPLHLEFKTYLTQQMLEGGFLASNVFYASVSHSEEIIASYFLALEAVFEKLAGVSNSDEVRSLLKGHVSHNGFKRIN